MRTGLRVGGHGVLLEGHALLPWPFTTPRKTVGLAFGTVVALDQDEALGGARGHMDSLVAFVVLVGVGVLGVAGAALATWMCLRGLLLLVRSHSA